LPHALWPAPQLGPQLELLHTCPASHSTVQEPQCVGSVAVLTQPPLQGTSPEGQAQPPLTHVARAGHTCPHAPQLLMSFCSLTQAPPHCERPCAHCTAHVPFEQTWPFGHCVAQLPQ
jgi:hypothetical protein